MPTRHWLIQRQVPRQLLAALALLVVTVGASIALSFALARLSREAIVGRGELQAMTEVMLGLRDAETGQRGYLLTKDEDYLRPYEDARGNVARALERLSGGRPESAAVAGRLRPVIAAKFAELAATVAAGHAGQDAEALARVRSNEGLRLTRAADAILMEARLHGRASYGAIADRIDRLTLWLELVLIVGMIVVILLVAEWLRQTRGQLEMLDRARGQAEGTLAALRTEVAQREEAEARLRQMHKIESLGQLTGGIAHDFNNMLAVVMGGIELAKRKLRGDPDRAVALLDNAREGATRAATLTARLLAFSRNQPLSPAPLDVNLLATGMADMLRRTLGETIEVRVESTPELWRCYADPSEVENAVLNLAINARDAMPAGGVLTIATHNLELGEDDARALPDIRPGQYVRLEVCDTGTGMTPDVIERAFDPFFTTKPAGKGTGLGLSQVFGFAKQSGGHLAIESTPGEGTCVRLNLPRFTGNETPDAAGPRDESVPPGRADELILVVEDEKRVRHFAVDALRELGYTVLSADTPSAALALVAAQQELTLLFTDVVMPEMTGRDLAERVAALRPGLKVLYTTGYTSDAIVHDGVVDVGLAVILKPYSIAELAQKVRAVLDGGGINRTV